MSKTATSTTTSTTSYTVTMDRPGARSQVATFDAFFPAKDFYRDAANAGHTVAFYARHSDEAGDFTKIASQEGR